MLSFLIAFESFAANDSIPLIPPTGPYAVGTVIFYWKDHSRTYNYSDHKNDPRTIPVQIWYPGERGSNDQIAPYAGLFPDYELIRTNSHLRLPLHPDIQNAPLILIVPGQGMERFAYSQMSEELASQGFIVASADLPEIGYVALPDGFVIQSAERLLANQELLNSDQDKIDSFFHEAVKLGQSDLNFVLKRLEKLNAEDHTGRFTGKIDLNHIGIIGHGLGGRISAVLAANDNRIKAYASMEGIPPPGNYNAGNIEIPALMLCSSGSMYQARDQYERFLENCRAKVQLCELIDFGPNSLTDGPIIFPRSYKYQVDPFMANEILRKLLINFFNEEIRNSGRFEDGLGRYIKVKHKTYIK